MRASPGKSHSRPAENVRRLPEKGQLLRQLDQAQALLLQEQQNIQRLLTAGAPTSRRGFRDKIREWWEGIQQTPEG